MPHLHDVLVPLDGSPAAEEALRHARALARLDRERRFRLVRVVPSTGQGRDGSDPVRWRMERSEAGAYLASVGQDIEEAGCEVSREVLAGRPADEVVSYARRAHVDLTILTPSGRGGATRGPMGGTAHKIVHGVGTSVLLARPQEPETSDRESAAYRRVVVAVDGSPASEWALCEAVTLLPDDIDSRLLVVKAHRGGPRRETRRFLERARRRVERPGLRVELEVVDADHVARRLHDVFDSCEADLVVLSAHGASGSAPWPYGSVASNLLFHGLRPTLVLQDQPSTRSVRPPERREPGRPARPRASTST